MCAFDDLENEHLQLMILARELSRHLQHKTGPDRLSLFQVRTKLASVLIRHLKKEDWTVYPTLMQSDQADARKTACKLHDEMGSLADAFKAHMECWTTFSIEKDWDAYRYEATILLNALERRITLEDDKLYPLARSHLLPLQGLHDSAGHM